MPAGSYWTEGKLGMIRVRSGKLRKFEEA